MVPKLLLKIMKYAKKMNIRVLWSTNLTNCDEKYIKKILDKGLATSVHVSYNCYDVLSFAKLRGSAHFMEEWRLLNANIMFITKNYPKIPLVAETLILPETIEFFGSMHTNLHAMGVKMNPVVPLHPVGEFVNHKVPTPQQNFDSIMKYVIPSKIKGTNIRFSCLSMPRCYKQFSPFFEATSKDSEFILYKCGSEKDCLYVFSDGKVSLCFNYSKDIPFIGMNDSEGNRMSVLDIWEKHPFFTKLHSQSKCEETCDNYDSCRNSCYAMGLWYGDPNKTKTITLLNKAYKNGENK
jgi:hypothetical protein